MYKALLQHFLKPPFEYKHGGVEFDCGYYITLFWKIPAFFGDFLCGTKFTGKFIKGLMVDRGIQEEM